MFQLHTMNLFKIKSSHTGSNKLSWFMYKYFVEIHHLSGCLWFQDLIGPLCMKQRVFGSKFPVGIHSYKQGWKTSWFRRQNCHFKPNLQVVIGARRCPHTMPSQIGGILTNLVALLSFFSDTVIAWLKIWICCFENHRKGIKSILFSFQIACSLFGGFLAEIKNADENHFITNEIKAADIKSTKITSLSYRICRT